MTTSSIAIYCRTATLDPMEPSHLDEQEAACRKYAEEHGLTISTIYREMASGLDRERPGLLKLRHQYHNGEIQGLVVTDLARLARNQVHLAILLEEMEQYDITLYIVLEELDNSSVGKLIRMSLACCAEAQREKRNDRLLTK